MDRLKNVAARGKMIKKMIPPGTKWYNEKILPPGTKW
jgi:hypothetical protein